FQSDRSHPSACSSLPVWSQDLALWVGVEPCRLKGRLVTTYALDHVQLAMPANREAEARLFYGSLLGLTEISKPPNLAARGGAWFQCGSIQIHLGVEADFRPAKKAHPAFLVADLGRMTDNLLQAGFKIRYDQETIEGYHRAF